MARKTPKPSQSQKRELRVITNEDLSRVRLQVRAWYLRTLNADETGEYGKLLRKIEFLLTRAEQQIKAVLWDRATRVALQEALRHLVILWGPKFSSPLHLEIRISDTHLKFSLTVPVDAVQSTRRPRVKGFKSDREIAAEKSLHVVKVLMDRLQRSPMGRQLVFRRLCRPLPRVLRG